MGDFFLVFVLNYEIVFLLYLLFLYIFFVDDVFLVLVFLFEILSLVVLFVLTKVDLEAMVESTFFLLSFLLVALLNNS